MKHSPAPWSKGDRYSDGQIEIECADGRVVAVVWDKTTNHTGKYIPGPNWRPSEELDGNVALVLHSPELLKALQIVLAEFGNFCCENCINEEEMVRDHPELVAAIDQADSILKKVRGQ